MKLNLYTARTKSRILKNISRYFEFFLASILVFFWFHDKLKSQNLESAFPTYSQNFDGLSATGTLNPWTDNSTFFGWYSDQTTYDAGTGSSATGGMYSFGAAGFSDRALGLVSTGTKSEMFALYIYNNDLYQKYITALNVTYTGEEWRDNINSGGQHKLIFEYQIDATDINAGIWTPVTALDFQQKTPVITGAVNGNAQSNQTLISYQFPITLNYQHHVFLRWRKQMLSNSPGLAIDDLTITATYCTVPPVQGVMITGNSEVCENEFQEYSIPPIPGAQSYSWIVDPSLGTINSGQSTNIVLIKTGIVSGIIGGGQISVSPANSCGSDLNPPQIFVTMRPNASLALLSGAGSGNQNICVNTPLSPEIIYEAGGGATGVNINGLPLGLYTVGNFTSTRITGNPLVTGVFNYSVITSGFCAQATATGTITVNPKADLHLFSGPYSQNIFLSNPITDVVYSISGGGTGAYATGLPPNVIGTFDQISGKFTIKGTPSSAGTFNYAVNTTGTCEQTMVSETITVKEISISVINPKDQDEYDPCSNQIIQWNSYGTTGGFNIDYAEYGTNNWVNIATNVTGNSYMWNTPGSPSGALGGTYVVRVSNFNNPNISDQNDGVFYIDGNNEFINVYSPSGSGQQYIIGTPINIYFTAYIPQKLNAVKISLFANNGADLLSVIEPNTTSSGVDLYWTVPPSIPPSQNCFIKVENVNNPCMFQVSSKFSIIPPTWTNIAAGTSHTLGLTSAGKLFSWGSNYWSQLGNSSVTMQTSSPVSVSDGGTGNSYPWSKIAAGGGSSFGIKTDGSLWGWGDNIGGQLGLGTTKKFNIPEKINFGPTGTLAMNVSCGGAHTLVIAIDGTLYSTGLNIFGQLGNSNFNPYSNPSVKSFAPVAGTGKYKAAVACWQHSLGIQQNGFLYAWGNNTNGQLGIGNITTTGVNVPTKITVSGKPNMTWVSVAGGWNHTLALNSIGELYVCGSSALGLGSSITQVSSLTKIPFPVGVTKWIAIAAAGFSSYAVASNGDLYGWGNNSGGELGLAGVFSQFTPILIGNSSKSITAGYQFAFNIQNDGSKYCATGWNQQGQLGLGNNDITNRKVWTCNPALVPLKYEGSFGGGGGNPTLPPPNFNSPIWERTATGTATITASTSDADGNVYVAGTFTGVSYTIDNHAFSNYGTAGTTDIFIAKYDQNGVVQWANHAGGSAGDVVKSIALNNGILNVCGSFNGSFNPGSNNLILNTANTCANCTRMFLAQYGAADGTPFSAIDGGGGSSQVFANAICADREGSIYVAGQYIGNYCSIAGSPLLPPSGLIDTWVAKFSFGHLSQSPEWVIGKGGTGTDIITSIACNSSGNLIVTGVFNNTVPFVNGSIAPFTSAGGSDIFVATINQFNGIYTDAKRIGGTGNDGSTGITIDESDNIGLCGYFTSPTLIIGNNTLTNSGSLDAFVGKFDNTGTPLWASSANGTKEDRYWAITSDPDGNFYTAGFFKSATLTLDANGATVLTNNGVSNIAIVEFGPNGALLDAVAIGNAGDSRANAICYSKTTGNAFVAGYMATGSISFPNGNPEVLTASEASNILLLNYGQSSGKSERNANQNASVQLNLVNISKDQFVVYPNPSSGNFTIQIQSALDGLTKLQLINLLGKQVFSEQKKIQSGENTLQIKTDNIVEGVYLLKVSAGEKNYFEKIIINKY